MADNDTTNPPLELIVNGQTSVLTELINPRKPKTLSENCNY